MTLVAGTYNVTASKVNYTPQTVTGVVIVTDTITTQDFSLPFLGSWTQIALPAGCPDWTRLDAKYFAATGLAYILGGRSGTTTDGTIYSFDPVAHTCANTGKTMSVPISNYTIVPLNDGSADLLCTFGGRDSAGNMTLTTQCYNPITNAVVTKANLPSTFTGFLPGGAAAVNGKAYIFGGFRNTSAPYNLASTYEYDPIANTFTQVGDISLARAYINVAVVDGLIYGFGGDTYDGTNLIATTKAEVFDPVAGTWNDAAVADLSTATSEGRAYGFDTSSGYELAGKVIVAGGGQWPGDTNAVFSYDVATNTYDDTFPDLNITRRNQAGFFVPGDPGAMWVFGGRSSAVGYGGDNPPYAPPEYKPVNLAVLAPKIGVNPASLAATLLPDTTTTLPITITNSGNAPLNWNIIEVPGMKVIGVSSPFIPVPVSGGSQNSALSVQSPSGSKIVAPTGSAHPEDVLWDQPLSSVNQNAYVNQEFPDVTTFSSFLADDFTNAQPWMISTIFVPGNGWNGFTTLLNATSLTWQLYKDNAGVPDGDPSGGGNPPVWTLTLPPTDTQVTISNGSGALPSNTTLNLTKPIFVPPGTYWLVFYPTLNFSGGGQYGRQASDTTNNYHGQFINPGGGFGYGTSWQDWAVIGATQQDIAFRLEGKISDVPWLSENPTSGTVKAGGSSVVQVTFDSTGLTPGQYLASLDFNSNDPATPVVNVPVSLTVQSVDLALTKTADPNPVRATHELTYTLLASNLGPQDATGVKVVDTLPASVTFVRASAGCSEAAGQVLCLVYNLAVGDVAEITIVVTPNEVGLITNTARVDGAQLDPNPGNNTATQETTVIPDIYKIYLSIMHKTP
jgi:uncharacterized repeat protein (TIGR01451 family)